MQGSKRLLTTRNLLGLSLFLAFPLEQVILLEVDCDASGLCLVEETLEVFDSLESHFGISSEGTILSSE